MDASARASSIDGLSFAVEIVAAYVANNSMPASDIPELISSVHAAILGLGAGGAGAGPAVERASPAQVRKSINPDHLVSFEDGRPYKTLRRHLTLRGLTPEAYRAKWGLPHDYPMTAQSYSAQRSELARALGLGQQRRKPRPAAEPDAAPRGRRKPAASDA